MTEMDILYSQRALTEQIKKAHIGAAPVAQRIFKKTIFETSPLIDIEIIEGNQDIPSWSDPDEFNPNPVRKGKRTIKEVTIPRIYEAKEFTARELSKIIKIGAMYNHAKDRNEAIAEYVADEIVDLKSRAVRGQELVSCQLLETGTFTFTGPKFSSKVDFGFVTGKQKITLAGGDKWDAATAPDILNQVRTWKKIVKGANVGLLGGSAADKFVANQNVKEALHNNNYKLGALDLTGVYNESELTYLGNFAGIEWYEYVGEYIDAAGTAHPYISAGQCILVNNNKQFRRHFAPVEKIQDDGSVKSFTGEFLLVPYRDKRGNSLEWSMEQWVLPAIWDLEGVCSIKTL